MTTQESAGWLTIRQAALTLGVSELTVRRRIKDRKVAFRLDGGKYFVNLGLPAPIEQREKPVASSDALQVAPDQVTDATSTAAPPVPALESLLPELSRLAEQAGRASALAEQVVTLEQRCASLQHDLITLSTRNGWLESQVREREKEVLQLADSTRRKGWRRLFG